MKILRLAVGLTILSVTACAARDDGADDGIAGSTEEAIRDRSQALDDFFPIAADYQPHGSFDTWKSRGVNTMIRVPPGDDVNDWTARANKLGLRMIREPRKDPKDDLGEKNLLAWHWEDEPELHGDAPSKMKSDVAKWRAIDPSRPISVNFWGGGILQNHDGCMGSDCYADYVKQADFVSDDIYPCNKYGCNIKVVGEALDKLGHWADGPRSTFAYIETSDFDGNGSGPSPRRYRAEVWDAIIHGARGVFYFCVRLKPSCKPGDGCLADYDATPSDVVDEMKQLHPLITKLAPVLQRAVDPKAVDVKVDAPLEAGWRLGPDGSAYFIVLNTGDKAVKNAHLRIHGITPSSVDIVGTSRTAKPNGDNDIVDDFRPYEERIYRAHP